MQVVGDLLGEDAWLGQVFAVPVFVGHYWLTGTPTPLAANVACTDDRVAKGGKLVAYRWEGETALSANKSHWVKTE